MVVGQRVDPNRAVIGCRVAQPGTWCRGWGSQGLSRGTGTREFAHEPFGRRPTVLLVRLRRYKCSGVRALLREDLTAAAAQRARLSRRGVRWALEALVVDHLTVARIGAGLEVSWHMANDAVLAEGKRQLIDDPGRFDGVKVVGVDGTSGAIPGAVAGSSPSSSISLRCVTRPVPRGCWTWCRGAPRVCSEPGSPTGPMAGGRGRGRRDGRLDWVQDRR